MVYCGVCEMVMLVITGLRMRKTLQLIYLSLQRAAEGRFLIITSFEDGDGCLLGCIMAGQIAGVLIGTRVRLANSKLCCCVTCQGKALPPPPMPSSTMAEQYKAK